MQFSGQAKPPVGVVFDSDMGAGIDRALALALLYGLDGKNECRVAGLSVSRHDLHAAAFCEAVARFYAGAPSPFLRIPPIGMAAWGPAETSPPMVAEPASKHKHGIASLLDTAEPHALLRNALTAQHDANAIVVLAGPPANADKALALPNVKELVARKVRYLVTTGAVPAGWPGPVVTVGDEIGAALRFPAAAIEKDFAWSPAHPIVDAYRAFQPMPYDAPTTAMAAVLYAVRPKENYFRVEETGPQQSKLVFDPAQAERIVKAYIELASAKPVPRARIRPAAAEKPKPPAVEPPKPPTN